MDWDSVSPYVIKRTLDLEDYDYNISFSENLTYVSWS